MKASKPSSLDDFGEFQNWFEQFGNDFGNSNPSIDWLREAHPDLVESLKNLELHSAIRWIASLETIPDLLANTVRINVLLHLTVACCHGQNEATVGHLRNWVRHLQRSPMEMQEDPPEDVFVGYVCSPDGGFRVFPGIISHADFILERLLRFLGEKVSFPNFNEAYSSVLALLKLSEAIAKDLQLPRYSVESELAEESLTLPADALLERHAEAVSFDSSRLEKLGVGLEQLAPFLFDLSKLDEFSSETLLGSSLEKRPLLQTPEGELVVASPSLLCRASTIHILDVVPIMGGWAETFFEKESAEFFVNRILKGIGVTPGGAVNWPKPPSSLPPLYQFAGDFDHGIFVIGLTWSTSIIRGSDLEEVVTFTKEQVQDFNEYLAGCCSALEGVEGFKGGMVLFAMSSVGNPIVLGFNDLRPKWRFFCAGLGDWFTLSGDSNFSAKRLWYLAMQEEMAEKANLKVMNTSGLLNLYGYWKKNGFALIPKEVDPRNPNNMMLLGGQTSQLVNQELKNINDRHCVLYPGGSKWIEVQRQGAGLNPDLSTNRMYCDFESLSEGVIRGCVELGDTVWWIQSTKRPEVLAALDLVYRLWDCVFSWAERILLVLSEKYPEWVPADLIIDLEFPEVDSWTLTTVSEVSGDGSDLKFDVDSSSVLAGFVFEQGFLTKFYRPDNVAEREIVAAILRSASEVSGIRVSDEEIEQCCREVTKDENTRFFHILRATTLESAMGEPGNAKPTLIPEEEMARIGIGLAHTVKEDPPAQITDADEARIFLDDVVAGIQARLSSALKEFWILPVVSHSFSQLDELSRDGSRWRLSTRSLLSMEGGAEWVRERLRSEDGLLVLAGIANRVLIETAVYSYEPQAREIISQTEHASLLAEIGVMVELANYRDAVANGFVDANITVHPNGAIEYDNSFQHEVVQPYLRSRIDDKIQWDADSYGDNFGNVEAKEDSTGELPPERVAFEKAFHAEYGFSHETLFKVIEVFDEFAIRSGEAGGTVEALVFRQVLKNGAGLTEKQVESFVDRFVLPIRPGWNRKFPKGCDANDVLPWRYFRGLSVLVRPFVEVSRSPRQIVISAPHLHRWGEYLTQSIFLGHLPEKLFQSKVMKSYQGSIAHKKGHEFAESVAEAVKEVLPNVKLEIKLTELGAPSDPDLGDIDVFAWDPKAGIVFLIECKRLKSALNVRQVIQQLEEFRGDSTNPEDSLAKHQRRVTWLQQNPEEVVNITGIAEEKIRWIPLLVTSGRVPMSYIDATDFSMDHVIPFHDLVDRLPTFIQQDA